MQATGYNPKGMVTGRAKHRCHAWSALAVLVWAALWPFPCPLSAAEPSPSRVTPAQDLAADFRLNLLARQALQQDATLAPFNLGVSARANVLTVWGAIPSEALAQRTVERLRQVPGVADVRNELRIVPAPDSGTNRLEPPNRPAQPGPLPGSPAGRPEGEPSGPRPPVFAGMGQRAPAEAVAVMPPIAVSLRPPTPPESVLLAGRRTAPAPFDIASAIDRFRAADERFRQVRAEVKDGIVYLRGVVPQWEDMYQLAQVVSRWPGVERVILEDVQARQKNPLSLP
jgi:hypothetical protein